MAGVRHEHGCSSRAWIAVCAVALAWGASRAAAQFPFSAPLSNPIAPPNLGASDLLPTQQDIVSDVRIVGQKDVPIQQITSRIKTRAGRTFNLQAIQDDVKRLHESKLFFPNIITKYQRDAQGRIVVIYYLVERPKMRYVKYVGNTIRQRHMEKNSGLKSGQPLDPYLVEEGRRKLQEYYHSKGYSKATVKTMEGSKPDDRGVVFLINEGLKQKVYSVQFVGNQIATGQRLKTQISTRRPYFFFFKGEVDRDKIEQDVEKLTAYYRNLGFFQAKIGRELEFNEDQNKLTVTFVIDEGVRYKVRNVTFQGNKVFTVARLSEDLKLKSGDFFDQTKMSTDQMTVTDIYGAKGYVAAKIQPDPRFLEQPGELDLVYSIEEGSRYRVGRIDVRIDGDNPHTRRNTILNRIELRPGDIVDSRKLRDSERRLKGSGLFKNDPQNNITPTLTAVLPGMQGSEDEDGGEQVADKPKRSGRGFRGQSPDPEPGVPSQPSRVTASDDAYLRPNESLEIEIYPYPGNDIPSAASPPPKTWRGGIILRMLSQATDSTDMTARPLIPTSYRAQSPSYPAYQPANTFAAPYGQQPAYVQQPYTPSPAFGQQPMGRIDPTAPSSAPRGNVVPVQYTTQVPGQPYAQGAPTVAPNPSSYPYNGTTPYGSAQPAGTPYMTNPPGGGYPPLNQLQPAAGPPAYPQPAYSQPSYAQPNGAPIRYGQPVPPGPTYGQVQPNGANPGAYGAPAGAPYGASPPVYMPPSGIPPIDRPAPGQPGALPPPNGYSDPNLLFPREGTPEYLNGQPTVEIPLQTVVQETQTGRFMVGVGVNSNAGLIGNIVIDEQNFDISRFPTSWSDLTHGAFRGAGQQFRLEAQPGTVFQRYSAIFREPYLFDTMINMGLSGYYFMRFYPNQWNERRAGGRVAFGYQFAPDLTGNVAFKGERVNINTPTLPTPAALTAALGNSDLYSVMLSMRHDTRDSPFLPTQGHVIDVSFEQTFGTYTFSREIIDAQQFFLLHQRPDGSGRHTLRLSTILGFTGNDTPIFENFFAGGYNTIRGFYFRGASPKDQGMFVGGKFQWVNTVEYMFPVTADDMLKMVTFCDFGTVEPSVELKAKDFRVVPGIGVRIAIPAFGPAPLALDLGIPVAHAPGDRIYNFSFNMGMSR